MILNITYPDKVINRQLKETTGPAFSFIQRIRMGGIGCAKLKIEEASPDIFSLISANNDTAYCNIELRTKGAVLGFNSVGRIYAWCIPYYQLNLYYNFGKLSIYGAETFVKAVAPFNGSIDRKFISKVLKLKSDLHGDFTS